MAVRLAWRDLSRYRARSGSALAAISLGVLISVIISVLAATRYGDVLDYAGPNLSSDQLVVYTPNGANGPPIPGRAPGAAVTTRQLNAMDQSAHRIASSLGSHEVVTLETTTATLRHAAAGRNWNGTIYVATPQLLRSFGIDPAQVEPSADILTMRSGLSTISHMQLVYGTSLGAILGLGPSSDSFPCLRDGCLANPRIQELRSLPSGTSAPNTVITEHAVHQLGLTSVTAGWLVQTSSPISSSQINSVRSAAAAAGMTVETKNDEPSGSEVINLATVFGIVLALGIVAMTIGLIRSETASELRTLTATGASGATRRTLTAASAGALALLGALLGTVAGYVGVIGYLRTNSLNGGIAALGNVPVVNLVIILLGMPLVAAAIAWIFAGREPRAVAHRPME